MSVGEEYQIWKREREYHGCGEKNITWQMKRGSNIIFPLLLWLLGRIEVEKKKQDIKNGIGEEYQVVWNFIHPCNQAVIETVSHPAIADNQILGKTLKNGPWTFPPNSSVPLSGQFKLFLLQKSLFSYVL